MYGVHKGVASIPYFTNRRVNVQYRKAVTATANDDEPVVNTCQSDISASYVERYVGLFVIGVRLYVLSSLSLSLSFSSLLYLK